MLSLSLSLSLSMKEDQDQDHLPPSTIPTDTSSLSCPILLNSPQDQGATHKQLQQQEPDELLLIGGSSDHPLSFQPDNNDSNIEQQPLCDLYTREGEDHEHGSVKWMSSKMRMMRKMMGSDQIPVSRQRRIQALQDQAQKNHDSSSSSNNNNSNSSGGIIRVCSNCNTTKTPLWRSGPSGPKSLCNACGIRQMKARRAMAATSVSSGVVPANTCNKMQKKKEKRTDVDRIVPFKKRFKITTSGTAQKKLQFDDVKINLSKNFAFYQTFPQEEKDAAILLMALSSGLIHG